MRLSRAALALAGIVGTANAGYVLKEHYDAKNFESGFLYDNKPDPTMGTVQYVDGATARSNGLTGTREGEIYIGVDHKTKLSGEQPRQSVRVKSKNTYTTGLFVFDVTHMPVGCTVWPAIWTFGDSEGTGDQGWPFKGEIDIIEGIHNAATNSISLHMGPGCEVSNKGSLSEAKPLSTNDCSAPAGKGQDGCKQETEDGRGYGALFNQRKGGVYVMEWTDKQIAVWFFPRDGPQPDFKNPNPATWSKPLAKFTNCDFKKHFRQHRIIINITLCGTWAGAVWESQTQCNPKTISCAAYVAKNAEKYSEAFWQIKSISTYAAQ